MYAKQLKTKKQKKKTNLYYVHCNTKDKEMEIDRPWIEV